MTRAPPRASLSTGAATLSTESFTTEQAQRVMGDGDLKSCEEISFFYGGSSATTALVGLAIGLAFVGFAAAWASVFCYNRIRAGRR